MSTEFTLFPQRSRAGFSLVEVVLALGIASFAMVVIMGLLPTGLKSAKVSVDESNAINLLSAVISDRMASPFTSQSIIYQIPALTNTLTAPVTNYFGVSENNQYSGSDTSKARYRVSYIVQPPSAVGLEPYRIWIRVSWPAQATNFLESIEGVTAFRQP